MELSKKQIASIFKKIRENPISYKFLAKGNHNENYLVNTKKSKFVLRIKNNLQFKNLKKEYNLLKSLKPNLGPKVFLFNNTHKTIPNDYLIEEFIEGKHPSRIPTNDFVICMAKWFKKLHSITKNTKIYLPELKIKPYHKNYLKYNKHIKDNKLKSRLEIYFKKATEICKENNNLFSKRKNSSLLHGDPSSENIFYKKGYIRLIDWEFTSYNPPEMELVYFLDSYSLTKSQIKLFLKTYEYPNTKIAKKRLCLISIISLCANIGYSLWRLDIAKDKKTIIKTNKRLLEDTNKLGRLLNGKI